MDLEKRGQELTGAGVMKEGTGRNSNLLVSGVVCAMQLDRRR